MSLSPRKLPQSDLSWKEQRNVAILESWPNFWFRVLVALEITDSMPSHNSSGVINKNELQQISGSQLSASLMQEFIGKVFKCDRNVGEPSQIIELDMIQAVC